MAAHSDSRKVKLRRCATAAAPGGGKKKVAGKLACATPLVQACECVLHVSAHSPLQTAALGCFGFAG